MDSLRKDVPRTTREPSYKETRRELKPSTRAILAGYDSRLSERSVKPPLFRTSTFEFTNAEEGRQFFQRAYHLQGDDGEDPVNVKKLIYTRFNRISHNPSLFQFNYILFAFFQNRKENIRGAKIFAAPLIANIFPVFGQFILLHIPYRRISNL